VLSLLLYILAHFADKYLYWGENITYNIIIKFYKGVLYMDSYEVLKTLATYFMAEIKNTITINEKELIVELADNTKVRITAKV
jgi:hypothetical protein